MKVTRIEFQEMPEKLFMKYMKNFVYGRKQARVLWRNNQIQIVGEFLLKDTGGEI